MKARSPAGMLWSGVGIIFLMSMKIGLNLGEGSLNFEKAGAALLQLSFGLALIGHSRGDRWTSHLNAACFVVVPAAFLLRAAFALLRHNAPTHVLVMGVVGVCLLSTVAISWLQRGTLDMLSPPRS